jgi:hypothetical protein
LVLSDAYENMRSMAEPAPKRPPNNAVRVALAGTLYSTTWVNRFWLNITPSGTPTAANILSLSNSVSAAFRTRFGPSLGNHWTLATQRTVWYKDSTTEIAVDGSDTGSGTLTGAPEAAQCAYLINWAISGSYRGGHPRTYLSGVNTEGLNDVNTLTTTRRAALNTAAAGFLADVNALTPTNISAVQLGTFRFFRNHAAVDPPVFEPFLSGGASNFLATQRRRIGR